MSNTGCSLYGGGPDDENKPPPDPWNVVERALPLVAVALQSDSATTTILTGTVVVALVWHLIRRNRPGS